MINLPTHNQAHVEMICSRDELSRQASLQPAMSPAPGNKSINVTSLDLSDRTRWKASQRVEASVRHMMTHLNQPLKVSTLSALAGLSNSSFYTLFKSATGYSPMDFFIRARMRQAAELLDGTTLLIKEVATRLGYDDPYYFSRLFKAVHGLAPTEYRAVKDQSGSAPAGPNSLLFLCLSDQPTTLQPNEKTSRKSRSV